MTKANLKKYIIDVIERVVVTFAEALLGAIGLLGLSTRVYAEESENDNMYQIYGVLALLFIKC